MTSNFLILLIIQIDMKFAEKIKTQEKTNLGLKSRIWFVHIRLKWECQKAIWLEFTGEILTEEVLWEGIYPMSHIVSYEKK